VEVTVKATEARIGENQAAEEVVESIEKLKPMFAAGNLDRPKIRKELQRMTKYLKETTGDKPFFNKSDKEEMKATVKSLTNYFEFAPRWVVFCISLALGLGTMIGWKRIVVTIGEKIGKTHLTYAQGATAELIGASTIALSTVFHAPVSTTHVLSSAIAGTMMAKDGRQNLQRSTLINILTAWILTLPVTIIVSGGLYYLFAAIFG
jgi:PiT family inorganic phosphate transporter